MSLSGSKRHLILYVPVIHAGYLNFFNESKDQVDSVLLISDGLINELSIIKPDIAAIPNEKIIELLNILGYEDVKILSEKRIKDLAEKPLLLIQDELSRALVARYFPKADIEWSNVFLRWDTKSVHTQDVSAVPESKDLFDRDMMVRAYEETKKSSDWWRQVGAVLVKQKEVLDAAHNQGMPNDHAPYQRGAVRDFLSPGVQPELVDTIHAEQALIARAARRGIVLEGASVYVTHFPCPVCAKLIITSGIKNCFFSEGWSTLASAPLLEAAGVVVRRVVV